MGDSPLNDLPGELRNNVYRLTMDAHGDESQDLDISNREPALLLACKQIRVEARPLLYHKRRLEVTVTDSNTVPLTTWLGRQPRPVLKKVKNIRVVSLSDEDVDVKEGTERECNWKSLATALLDAGFKRDRILWRKEYVTELEEPQDAFDALWMLLEELNRFLRILAFRKAMEQIVAEREASMEGEIGQEESV